MEQCPQCQAERVPSENFCEMCGYKYSAGAPAESDSVPSVDDVGGNVVTEHMGAIYLQVGDGSEYPVHFDEQPKVIGRQDVSDFLHAQNIDPLQVSRKQCTISKEGEAYFIEDGVTSVQDKESGNHTVVNGKDITGQGKITLNDGDTIQLATVVNAIFRIA